MRGFTKGCAFLAVAGVVLVPAPVRADGYVTPWLGVNFVDRTDEGNRTYGVTTGYMGAGVFGFEADFGYTPEFFLVNDGFGKRRAVTTLGNFILGIPIGGTDGAGVRPFVTGGFGLMWTHLDTGGLVDVSRNEFCYELGAGMMGFFADHFGLRGDLRYLRTLNDTILGSEFDLSAGRLRFWRLSGGVTFR
jgi:hypothetical protein